MKYSLNFGMLPACFKHRRMWAGLLVFCTVGSIAFIILAEHAVGGVQDRVVAVEQAPQREAALVLGCSPTFRSGAENTFFRHRINTAAELFHSGTVRHLIVSGDNSRPDYDEPTAMKRALMAKGVPEVNIALDYAGFSTLDSVVRAREIFNQSRLLVVSQRSHAMRAVYIAQARGLDIIGVQAPDVEFATGLRNRAREAFARVRAVLDVKVWNRQPRFLGPKVPLSQPQ